MSLKHLAATAALLGVAAAAGSAVAQPLPSGADLFAQNCSACHQITGKGIPGAFPALAGNPFVQGPPLIVASTVINGRAGMPSFREELSSAEIAAILTYVRSAWGNTAGPIDTALVDTARGGAPMAPAAPSVLPFH